MEKYKINGYEIKVVETVEEVEELRSNWENMQWHPNADIDFYLTIIDSRTEIIRPHILTLYKNNKAVAMLIGRIENIQLEFKIGYKVFWAFAIRSLTIIYGGILGESNLNNMKIFIEELVNYLNKGEIDVIFFSHLKIGSDLYNLSMTMPNFMSRDFSPVPNTHWTMTMPSSIDEFFKKLDSKKRRRIRQKNRELENNYSGKVTFKIFTEPSQVEQMCKDVEHIARKTYHRGFGVGFTYNKETISRMTLEAKSNRLRAYLLYIDNKPCSFWIGTLYKGIFYLDYTAYDPQYHKNEIGTVSFSKMMEDLCTLNRIKIIDFGSGDALYKNDLCDTNWQEASIYIFPSSVKGIAINLLRTTNVIISRCAESFLKKTNLLGLVKRRWRKRLEREKIIHTTN